MVVSELYSTSDRHECGRIYNAALYALPEVSAVAGYVDVAVLISLTSACEPLWIGSVLVLLAVIASWTTNHYIDVPTLILIFPILDSFPVVVSDMLAPLHDI